MNKDVIYIEPEDDITDIITKIENSKEKIVALVPPKKAGVFRSIVNIKLIAKSGLAAGKSVVLVTVDPSIVKLAAATRLPVTKNLQTAPVIPEATEAVEVETVSRETVDEDGKTETIDSASEIAEKTEAEVAEKAEAEESGEEDIKSDKKAELKKKASEKAGAAKKFSLAWLKAHKKLVIGCGVGLVVLIIVMIWAFGIAPAATVTVGIRTTKNNFSENVTFTDKLADENTSEGKFYLDEKKMETKTEVTFTATGKKNVGEKATGEVVVYTYIDDKGGTISVSKGDTFVNNDHAYIADNGITFSYDGKDTSVCDNENVSASEFKLKGCLVSGKISVTASAPGSDYNIAATDTGWSTTANVRVYSDTAMSGGTDKEITVVQQSDVDKAKEKVQSENESVNKEKLFDTLEEGAFIIESSFKQTVGDAVVTPAVGEEVKDGEEVKLSVTTTDTVYVIDKTKVEEFISEKAKLAENFKIYEMNDPFIENFIKTDNGYTGKLKTSYISGPKVTENDVVEIIKGKGLGMAQHDLKSIDGIGTITIKTSFPWVTSIPSNPNKITVIIDVEE